MWQVNPPAGQQVCATSRTSDNGIGAVGFGPDKDHCNGVAAIDAKAGKQLWTTQLTLPGNFQGYTGIVGALSVAQSTVVVNDPETAFGFGPPTARSTGGAESLRRRRLRWRLHLTGRAGHGLPDGADSGLRHGWGQGRHLRHRHRSGEVDRRRVERPRARLVVVTVVEPRGRGGRQDRHVLPSRTRHATGSDRVERPVRGLRAPQPLATRLVGDKIVQFGSPKAPVTVWH